MLKLEEIIYKYRFIYNGNTYYVTVFETTTNLTKFPEVKYVIKNKSMAILFKKDEIEPILQSFKILLKDLKNEIN